MTAYHDALVAHYRRAWGRGRALSWARGPTHQLPPGFRVLEHPPGPPRNLWTYATAGMSVLRGSVELHLFSHVQSDALVELLTVVAHYHHTGAELGLHHTVNFGRPWLPGSIADRGFISLPYLDGPSIEVFASPKGTISCLWLLPVTPAEVELEKQHGVEALERRFEAANIDFASATRQSVV